MTDLNKVIEERLKIFIGNLSNASDSQKKLFHYNTVINVSSRVVFYSSGKAEKCKEKIISYFEELESREYDLKGDKFLSSKLHNKYILPSSLFLFDHEKFLSDSDLTLLIIIGMAADFILYYFIPHYYYPVFIFSFLALGIYRRKKAKKEGKFFKMFW